MDDADGKNKEGKNTDGMLQDDDEMDIDAQIMQAAQPVHTRRLGRLRRAHKAEEEPMEPSASATQSQAQHGTEGASRPRDARSCSPNLSQEDTRASNEKGSPRLGSTHSQSNAASPRAAASPSSKASEDEAQSGNRGSEAGSTQPSGGKATPAKQEATSPATAPGSGIASDDNGSAGTPVKSKRRKKEKKKSKKGKRSKKDEKAEEKQLESQEQSARDDYWDEEDELEEYIMKRDLGQIKERSGTGSDSSHSDSEGGGKGSDAGQQAASDDEQGEDEGPVDTKQLAAETQRVLREAARSDRLGKGALQKIEPLTGVLAKILERKQAIIDRAAQEAARAAAAPQKQPPPKSPFASEAPGPGPVTDVAEDDEDLLLVESDEEGLAAEAAALAARRTFALQHDSLFGLDSQSQQAAPMPMPAESAPAQASRLSQGASLLHGAPAASDAAAAPSKEAALAVNQALDAEPPTLCLQLDSATQPELLPLQDPTPMEEADERAKIAEEAAAAAEDASEEEGEEADSDGDADDEGSGDSSGEDDEEEEYISSGGSSSSSDDEDEAGADGAAAEPDAAAKQRALEEARAMLADRPRSKKKRSNAWFEEEAELSEDGGHSDDDSDDDGDAAEQEKLLADLIGAEQDGKRDEKMRAKLHAAWLEQQDTARVEALLHGVKNGFRKKRSALDDEGGTHYEAAMRRAALMNTDDEESEGEEDGSGGEGSDSEPEVDLQAKIDALSDDDAKEELKEAQLRKLMEDSQKEEAKTLTLLDDDSRAVLGLLRHAAPEPQQPLQRSAASHGHRAPLASDITNRPHKSSFLGRGSGSAALLAKSSSNFGNTRSFIFGSENRSNQGATGDAAQAQDEDGVPSVPSKEGPTSFAGLHLSAGRGSLGRQRGSGLLSMLHTKDSKRKDVLSPLAAEVDASAATGDAAQHVKAMLQSKRRAMRR
ncbi:g5670 [Coccomyxa viridis]|uniref:G5670 protein n=1 Tax=Coccomyxa viridis TaxID=1274662 RepID=A0ABP1FTD2_9CHLO